MGRVALCFMLVFALSGCRKKQKGPDANYDKASRIYQQLYASELDESYGDPKMEQVVTLLKLVDPASIDKPDADALLGTISRGRDQLAKDRAEREKAATAAAIQAARPPDIDPTKVIAASEPDAGTKVQDPYGEGAAIAEINTASGGCLSAMEPWTENGTGKSGTVYRLASPACNSKLPGFVGQAVLVENGKIYRRLSDAELPRPTPVAPPPRDAGTAQATPRQPPPQQQAETPDAGGSVWYPGMPLPEGTQLVTPSEDAGQ